MADNQTVILTGATGEIGSALVPALIEHGYRVIAFVRDPAAARDRIPGAAEYIRWNTDPADTDRGWVTYMDGAYGVINCAGANVFAKRYTAAYAKLSVDSRIDGTRKLIDGMREVAQKPQIFINSSSQGYYGITDFDDRMLDENSPAGYDKWGVESQPIDASAFTAESLGVRVVSIRTGYVLDWRGGGLPQTIAQMKKGQGGATTPKNAWRSWIHITDEVGLYLFALDNDQVRGGLNGTAPNSITSAEFANALSLAVSGKPNTRSFPGFMLKLFMGPAADLITHGKRVVPKKALDLGYRFKYPTAESALADLVPKIQQAQGGTAR